MQQHGCVTGDRASQDFDRGLWRRGALVTALFALLWAVTGASGITNAAAARAVRLTALAITVVAVLLILKAGAAPGAFRPRRVPADWSRRFNRVGAAQGVGIGSAVALLFLADAPMLIPTAVCLIVGAHFFPLAQVFDQPQHTWTGTALCLVAASGLTALAAVDAQTSLVVVGLGAALVLWSTSLHVAVHR